jgi:hypothetical protein
MGHVCMKNGSARWSRMFDDELHGMIAEASV